MSAIQLSVEKCKIRCQVGGVLMEILDQKTSYRLKTLAYLAPEKFEEVPLVLGYDRCLEFFTLEANIPDRKAQLLF